MAEEQGPFANPARAAVIALMDKIALAEFTELTGVGVGDYGIYRVDPSGVSIRATGMLAELTVGQQNAIHKAAQQLTLAFPCAPALFLTWYDATRGKNLAGSKGKPGARGVSDFSLAKGFAEELQRHEGPSAQRAGPSVPSGDIISAFKVRSEAPANAKWWDTRLRNPGRYRLTSARALTGGARRPSRWYPDVVAGWLIHEKHALRDAVLRAMRQRFPDFDVDLL